MKQQTKINLISSSAMILVFTYLIMLGSNNNLSAQTFTGDLILQKNGKVVLSGAFTVRITEKEISIKHPTTYLVTEVTSDGDMIEWRRIITDINSAIIGPGNNPRWVDTEKLQYSFTPGGLHVHIKSTGEHFLFITNKKEYKND